MIGIPYIMQSLILLYKYSLFIYNKQTYIPIYLYSQWYIQHFIERRVSVRYYSYDTYIFNIYNIPLAFAYYIKTVIKMSCVKSEFLPERTAHASWSHSVGVNQSYICGDRRVPCFSLQYNKWMYARCIYLFTSKCVSWKKDIVISQYRKSYTIYLFVDHIWSRIYWKISYI